MNPSPLNIAEALNLGCPCNMLDRATLIAELTQNAAPYELADALAARPHLFSDTAVFIHTPQAQRIALVVQRLSRLLASPCWWESIRHSAPVAAQTMPANPGLWLGFDFHLGPNGPQLIEINTNPGGLLLNLVLLRAQRACCPDAETLLAQAPPPSIDEVSVLAMVRQEWQESGHVGQPGFVALVDDDPITQYLYPEFLLFQHELNQAGIPCLIVDPTELTWNGNELTFRDKTVDMVYNRLTDFYLTEPSHHALLAAMEQQRIVLAPHPHSHARYANKHHLARLSNHAHLAALGVEAADIDLFAATIPFTQQVSLEHASQLWAERRGWFFKPAEGFGSRAAYRGDKLTQRVWQEILQADYVAQRIAPPSRRRILQNEAQRDYKLDIRAYAYQGQVLLLAARLYDGQTTNFRTPGGGFAPVFTVPDDISWPVLPKDGP